MQKYVHLHTDNVELVISVTKKLKKQTDNLEKFGWITVSTGELNKQDINWDCLPFFEQCDFEDFKKECKEELREKGFKTKKIFKEIKQLLKEANKLNIL